MSKINAQVFNFNLTLNFYLVFNLHRNIGEIYEDFDEMDNEFFLFSLKKILPNLKILFLHLQGDFPEIMATNILYIINKNSSLALRSLSLCLDGFFFKFLYRNTKKPI